MNKEQERLWHDMESIAERVLSLRDCFQNDMYQMREDHYISKEALVETAEELRSRHEDVYDDLENWVFQAKMFILQMVAEIQAEEERNEQ